MDLTKTIVDNKTGEIVEERQLTGSNFIMLDKKNMNAFIQIQEQDKTAAILFTTLIQHMNRQNALVISVQTLADLLKVGRRTIERKIQFLRERNFITTLRTGGTNVFFINSNIAWTTHNDLKQYARFTADVIVSEAEQDAITLAQLNLTMLQPTANKTPNAKPKRKTQ